jgi:RNA polymerase sigma factor (TIGR02999 family)
VEGQALTPDGSVGRQADPLTAALYSELRAIAAKYCQHGTSGTLQPTMIVHEAFLKLAAFETRAKGKVGDGGSIEPWQDREHFLAVAATAMRQVLIDYARKRRSAKRASNGDGERVELTLVAAGPSNASAAASMLDVVELDDALRSLEAADPRAARVVELRFFAGMTIEETARAMGLGRTSVEESWRTARAWLLTQLHPDGGTDARDGTRNHP